jgi:serine phosphatase RsbU (regulator of sigma subunit)
MEQTFLIRPYLYKNYFQLQSILSKLVSPRSTHSFLPQKIVLHLKEPDLLNKKTRELNDSIVYAKRIQDGMMLKEKHLNRLFSESFLLFKPKDIVSGDFYWFTKIENKIIVAIADCTGHGIPGAFMSVLGISLLNQIVIEEGNTDTALILQRLDHKLKKAFGYSNDYYDEERHTYDGMDIALCCIDTELKEVQFSGAFRPLYHISKGNFNEIKGSRYPIGGLYIENDKSYKSQTINYETGDKVYLCSDGFSDQFGGFMDKKFMVNAFKKSLIKTSKLSMTTQQLELERLLNEWKNNHEQTDDILIMGFQL